MELVTCMGIALLTALGAGATVAVLVFLALLAILVVAAMASGGTATIVAPEIVALAIEAGLIFFLIVVLVEWAKCLLQAVLGAELGGVNAVGLTAFEKVKQGFWIGLPAGLLGAWLLRDRLLG